MNKKNFTKAQDLITNTLTLLRLPPDQIKISAEDDFIAVQIDLPDTDTGVLIGYQGETLASLQLILSLIVSQRLNAWQKIKLNIGDYRQRREEALYKKADQAAERALSTGQEIIIPSLNSYERHQIHEYLNHRSDVTTQSRGDEPYRHLYVIPKLTD